MERSPHGGAREPGCVASLERDRVAAGAAETLGRQPASCVRPTGPRWNTGCETPDRLAHAGPRFTDEDPKVAWLVVADAHSDVDASAQEALPENSERRAL